MREVADLVGAVLDSAVEHQVTGAATLDSATAEQISFLEDPRYLEKARASGAGVILTRERFSPSGAIQLLVDRPRHAFIQCLEQFRPKEPRARGLHPSAIIDPTAVLGEEVCVGSLAVLGADVRIGARSVVGPGALLGRDVRLGEDCRLHAGAVLLEGVRLGARVVIGSRTVVGSDGFGYLQEGGRSRRIPHLGTVIVEDDVEIGAGCCIDRAVTGATIVGAGTKIDNLVHVAHNVRIGRDCLVVAQVGISGSVIIGDGCTLAGKVGVTGHVEIGAGAVVASASRVVRTVPAGATVAGWPAMEVGLWRRTVALTRRLPEIWERIRALERALGLRSRSKEQHPHEDPSDGTG